MDEFNLIRRFFETAAAGDDSVVTGVGDDAAVLALPADEHLLITTDTLISGVHFPAQTAPDDIAYKALMVNLSDIAAMAGRPRWLTLALTLPAADESWLQRFSDSLGHLCRSHGVALVGGDTTRGALAISMTLLGTVPKGQAVSRAGACPGDHIYVTGELGSAGLALAALRGAVDVPATIFVALRQRLDRPTARIAEGLILRTYASSMIDVSDGLLADLVHVLQASGCGAVLDTDRLPLQGIDGVSLTDDQRYEYALSGGDDYELCFTLPVTREDALLAAWPDSLARLTRIGKITREPGLRLRDRHGVVRPATARGYNHFHEASG